MAPERQRVGNLASVKRLPTYLDLLRDMQESGRDIVSSNHIAEKLKVDAIQVRKDLAVTGISGKPKVGYYVPALVQAIEEFLGWNNTTEAFIVGAGNLGKALMGYQGFRRHGLNIVAAFDTDPEKVGSEAGGKQVLPLDKLGDLARRMHVGVGIITVPVEAAQAVADAMVKAGIKAIWNFAPVTLDVPPDVAVQNEDLAAGLAVLSVRAARVREGRS